MSRLHLSQDPDADALLGRDPLALLLGMLLDQQIPMEKAFRGPAVLEERLGGLDAAAIADMPAEAFAAVMAQPPAVHRFPGSMARRVQELCAAVVEEYAGDARAVWAGATSANDLRLRLAALPGFGEMKVTALASVLAKRFGVAAARPLVPDHPTLGVVERHGHGAVGRDVRGRGRRRRSGGRVRRAALAAAGAAAAGRECEYERDDRRRRAAHPAALSAAFRARFAAW